MAALAVGKKDSSIARKIIKRGWLPGHPYSVRINLDDQLFWCNDFSHSVYDSSPDDYVTLVYRKRSLIFIFSFKFL